jgi:hypothetical protein
LTTSAWTERRWRGAAAAILCAAAPAVAAACGGERAPVALAADRNAALVADFARTDPIADLAALVPPPRPDARPDTRFAPAELTLYEVSGTLQVIEKVADGDYLLILSNPDQPRIMMIAVSPDPACAAHSRFGANILAVRRALDRTFGRFSRLTPDRPVTATGIGFFAARPGPPGAAPNGFELSPLLGVAFP